MRGKDQRKGYEEWKAGITPAYAGKRTDDRLQMLDD